jgi:hypothetical protein
MNLQKFKRLLQGSSELAALVRVDDKSTETVLPSHAVFAGETIKPGQYTREKEKSKT